MELGGQKEEPEWIGRLRRECKRPGNSQLKVAAAIGYSVTVINRVLSGKYGGEHGGNLPAVREAVQAMFTGEMVSCPVLGEIPFNQCLSNQKLPFSHCSPDRVALYNACHGEGRPRCPNSRIGGE
jgi:hypothetical protein